LYFYLAQLAQRGCSAWPQRGVTGVHITELNEYQNIVTELYHTIPYLTSFITMQIINVVRTGKDKSVADDLESSQNSSLISS
jgi:hypothetical protein